MKLDELVRYLVNPELLEGLYQKLDVNSESDALLIYMETSLNVRSDVSIFEIEETDDYVLFEKDGKKYVQLFPVDHAIDLIESDLNLKDKGYPDLEIARRLLDYRLNDA